MGDYCKCSLKRVVPCPGFATVQCDRCLKPPADTIGIQWTMEALYEYNKTQQEKASQEASSS